MCEKFLLYLGGVLYHASFRVSDSSTVTPAAREHKVAEQTLRHDRGQRIFSIAGKFLTSE